jgi:transcription elongation factor Elf1
VDVKEAPIIEDCPRCGRPMSIRLQHIGKPISCGHCGCDCVVQIDQTSVMADAVVAQRYRNAAPR